MLRKIKRIRIPLKKTFIKIAEKAFLSFLGLLVVILVFSALLFYKYSFLAEKSQPEIIAKPAQINENLLEEILSELNEREKKFKEADFKQYSNPFLKTLIPEEVPSE